MQKNILPYIILALCCVPLFSMHIYDVHTWGDDFAQYIKEALNIANGVPYYEADYIFNPLNPEFGPPQYPPGFPLLIAPIVKVYGVAFKPLFIFISACLASLAFILYHFFNHYTKHQITAICLALMCVYCGGVLELKANILSDIPCWVFTALYLTLRQNESKGNLKLVLLILAASMAILIRTQALLILVAEGVYFIYEQILIYIAIRRLSIRAIISSFSFKIIGFSLVIFLGLNFFVFAAPNSGLDYYKNLLQFHQNSWADAIQNNLDYLYILLTRVFKFFPWQKGLIKIFSSVVTDGIFILSIVGIIRYARRVSTTTIIFYVLNLFLLIILSQQQGIRFILYMLPIYLLYAYVSLRGILNSIASNKAAYFPILGVVFTLLFFYAGKDELRVARENVPEAFIPTDTENEVFTYIKKNINDDDIIIFAKPRLLSLMTEKKSIVHAPQKSLEDNKSHFDNLGANYALISSKMPDQYLEAYISKFYPNATTDSIANGVVLYHLVDEIVP